MNQNRPTIGRTPKRCQPSPTASKSISSTFRPARELTITFSAKNMLVKPIALCQRVVFHGVNVAKSSVGTSGLTTKLIASRAAALWTIQWTHGKASNCRTESINSHFSARPKVFKTRQTKWRKVGICIIIARNTPSRIVGANRMGKIPDTSLPKSLLLGAMCDLMPETSSTR